MTIILEIPSWFEAWLIPHLMAKISASELVIWIAWWIVLVMGWLWVCICDIDVAVLFLMLESVTTMAVDGELDDSMTMLSSWRAQVLFSFCLLCKLNTIKSEKLSITLWPGESLKWRGEKKENSVNPIVHVYYIAFDEGLLTTGKRVKRVWVLRWRSTVIWVYEGLYEVIGQE